jgi:hypothetical protein
MNQSRSRIFKLTLAFLLLITFAHETMGAELTVQIRSPKDGSEITQEQAYVLVGGKAAIKTGGSGLVDIFLVIDVSASTALYAGVDFSEFSHLPDFYVTRQMARGRFNSNCSIRPGSH